MISERNVRFFAVLSMVALFCAGVGVGFAVDRLLVRDPGHRPPHHRGPQHGLALLDRFAERLDLTAEQKQATHEIMEEGRTATEQVVEKSQPEIDAIGENMKKRIAALLDEEQLEEYRKMLERGSGLPMPNKGKHPPPGKRPPPGEHRPPPGPHTAPPR